MTTARSTGSGLDAPMATLPFPSGGFSKKLGITFLEATAERLVATMPVEGNEQAFGVLHGGAHCALAESLGSVGALLHVWPEKVAFGIDINATHHRSVRSGLVTATAVALSLGRTLCSHEVTVRDDRGRLLCTARITNIVRPLGSDDDVPPRGLA